MGDSIQHGLSLEEKFFELQCQRVAQGFQYLRMDNRRGDRDLYKSGPDANISQRRGVERSVALTLAPYVTIVELTTGAKNGTSQELSVTTYCKTHVIQSDKKPTEYFFAFCGKFNQMYEPMNMNFNTRFRGKTYLGFNNLGKVFLNVSTRMINGLTQVCHDLVLSFNHGRTYLKIQLF